ncbi:MAG: hypothetical protein KAG53_04610 [Endozoicomonadaceae bacterium]|nr:hypothetical protein [Endozoicomonadaceae bacterium]
MEKTSENSAVYPNNTPTDYTKKPTQDPSSSDSSGISKETSRTPSNSLLTRSAKLLGKILCGVALAPVLIIAETTVSTILSISSSYIGIVKLAYNKNAILGGIASVTFAPLLSIIFGINTAVFGIFSAVVDTVRTASSLSTEPFVSTTKQAVESTKLCIDGQFNKAALNRVVNLARIF